MIHTISRRLGLLAIVLAAGIAVLALVLLGRPGVGPEPASAQLPELEVTITPDGCGEVAVAAVGAADAAFVYTFANPSAWAHATDEHVELRARARAGCTFTRWTVEWSGVTVHNTTANPTRAQMLEGMTATAHFSGAPTPCTQTTLGVAPPPTPGWRATVPRCWGRSRRWRARRRSTGVRAPP